MNAAHRQTWASAALLFGVAYFLIGRLSTLPADNVRVWRPAAWLASGIVYAAHIGYEHFRMRNSLRLLRGRFHLTRAAAELWPLADR